MYFKEWDRKLQMYFLIAPSPSPSITLMQHLKVWLKFDYSSTTIIQMMT